jgi:hypothetical protein
MESSSHQQHRHAAPHTLLQVKLLAYVLAEMGGGGGSWTVRQPAAHTEFCLLLQQHPQPCQPTSQLARLTFNHQPLSVLVLLTPTHLPTRHCWQHCQVQRMV